MSSMKERLKSLRPKPVPFVVEAWDGFEVNIIALTEKQRLSLPLEVEFDESAKDVCLLGLVDEQGEPLFDSIEDMEGNTIGGFMEVANAIIRRTMNAPEIAAKN